MVSQAQWAFRPPVVVLTDFGCWGRLLFAVAAPMREDRPVLAAIGSGAGVVRGIARLPHRILAGIGACIEADAAMRSSTSANSGGVASRILVLSLPPIIATMPMRRAFS